MTRRMTMLLLGLAMALAGCDACGGDRRVPFKLNEGGATRPSTGAAADRPAEPVRPTFTVIDGREMPKGTIEIEIDGTRINTAPRTLVNVLAHDFDFDGDRDVLAVALGESGRPELLVWKRNGAALEQASSLGISGVADASTKLTWPNSTCVVDGAALQVFAARLAYAKLKWQCGAVDARETADETQLLSFDEGRVHALERIAIDGPTELEPETITAAFGTRDVDGDGNDDIVATITTSPPAHFALPPIGIELPWLRRPAGLARDVREPDATLAQMVAAARTHLRNDEREQAEYRAHAAGRLFDALCRRSIAAPHPVHEEHPRVRIGQSEDGLSCRSSQERAVAVALEAIVRAKAGDAMGAWLALNRMLSGATIDARLQAQLQRALASLPVTAPASIEHPEQTFEEALAAMDAPEGAPDEQAPNEPTELNPPNEPNAPDEQAPPAPAPAPVLEPLADNVRIYGPTQIGVLVATTEGDSTRVVLVRPREWTSFSAVPNPSALRGRRLVYVREGKVEVLTLP